MIPEMRFFDYFRKGRADKCWLWRGKVSCDGYGLIPKCSTRAHRVSYQFFNGPIPPGLVIDHACHNIDPFCPGAIWCLHKRCVNPAHLEAVTNGENVRRWQVFRVRSGSLHYGMHPPGLRLRQPATDMYTLADIEEYERTGRADVIWGSRR